MKTLILPLLLFLTLNLISQPYTVKELNKHREEVLQSKLYKEVAWSLDTIYDAGIAYAIMIEDESGLYFDYHVYTLTGIEIIGIEEECDDFNSNCYYRFTFLDSLQKGEIEIDKNESLEDLIVESKLVGINGLNLEWKRLFLQKYPPILSTDEDEDDD